MFFKSNYRQKGEIKKGEYGKNNRARITQLVIDYNHLKSIEAIHIKKNSSKSYILEEILRYSLLYGEIKKEEIIRLKSLPKDKKINYIGSHTVTKAILKKIRELAKENDTTISVVIWHLLTLFFQDYPHYLQEEYLKS